MNTNKNLQQISSTTFICPTSNIIALHGLQEAGFLFSKLLLWYVDSYTSWIKFYHYHHYSMFRKPIRVRCRYSRRLRLYSRQTTTTWTWSGTVRKRYCSLSLSNNASDMVNFVIQLVVILVCCIWRWRTTGNSWCWRWRTDLSWSMPLWHSTRPLNRYFCLCACVWVEMIKRNIMNLWAILICP